MRLHLLECRYIEMSCTRVKTAATQIGLFLLLGAFITISIAWCGAFFVDPSDSKNPEQYGAARDGEGYAHWFVAVMDFHLGQRVQSYWVAPPAKWTTTFSRKPESVLPVWASLARPTQNENILSRRTVVYAHGWPFLTLASIIRTDSIAAREGQSAPATTVKTLALRAGHFDWKGSTRQQRLLPVIPLWPGCLASTLTYAALIWLVFGAPMAVRRHWRRKRRRCVHCGYDLRGAVHERCPECGSSVGPVGHEHPSCSSRNTATSRKRAAKCAATAALTPKPGAMGRDLAQIAANWADLPESMRQRILRIVDASE